jgi:hypothetical protein
LFLHEDSDDAAFWTSSILPSILWTSPALRAYSMMLDTFAVSEHSLICKGPEAPVFACRIRSFQEGCDCVAHCHEWLVSNEERYVKHDARFDYLHSLAAPYAALLRISIFLPKENLPKLSIVTIVPIVGSKWSLQVGSALSLRQYLTGHPAPGPMSHDSADESRIASIPSEHGLLVSMPEHIQSKELRAVSRAIALMALNFHRP